MTQPYLPEDDLLWRQLKTIPAFRASLRAVESRFYQQVELPGPILDVGCGDGHFAQMTFDRSLDVGIDPWWGPLQKAQRSGQYGQVLQSVGDRLPFPDDTFASAISNSVLEHIPDVQPVLNEVGRVLRPGGLFMITMPSHQFTQNLGGAVFFEALGLPGMADRYRRMFNFISRHAHTDAAEVWGERLAQAGFAVERWQYYFSVEALRALEWGHVQGLPSAILHALTGHWIVAPWESSLRRTERWVRPFYTEEAPSNGAYMLFIARKVANGPIEARLPGARPFTIAEMERAGAQGSKGAAEAELEPELELEEEVAELPQPVEPVRALPVVGPRLVKGGLALLALLFALMAQLGFINNSANPGVGLRPLLMSAFFLLLLWAYGRSANASRPARTFAFPRLQAIPRQRLLYLPALLLSLIALTNSNAGRVWLAFFFWFLAIGLALFALWPISKPAPVADDALSDDDGPSALIAVGLFVMALLLRTINLQNLPFILNGTEAGLGLEVLRVAQGSLASPFGSSAMGSPTLPLFLLALPVKWFGPSTVSLRLLSPLAGALTIVAVYWIGQRLWGRTMGLAAAILLLAGHLHLHYSRMGLPTIWDGLLALLALGLVGVAWQEQRDGQANGVTWLLAGTAVGLCAYFFTTALLLPVMLAVLFLLLFWADRANLRAQWRQILAAAALALVIALPQLLHNRSQPNTLWQQWQAASIFNPGSDWLAQEAGRTMQTESAVLRQQVWRGLLAFNGSVDKSPSYRTQNALLSFVPGLLFLLGLLLALFRLRDVRALLLLVWVGVTVLFTAVLIPDSPQSHWLVIVTPALALLGGFALVTLAQWQGMAQRTVLVVALVVAALLAVNDGLYYYGRCCNGGFPAENQFADRNTEAANDIANYLNTLGTGWTAYFYGPPQMYVDFPSITFLAQDFHKDTNLFDVLPAPDDTLPPMSSANRVFLFLPERAGEMTAVSTLYPGGEVREFDGRYATPLFYSYELGN